MTTCAESIEGARRLLMSGAMDERNTLSAAITTTSATTFTTTYALGGICQGVRVSIDLEDFYVLAVDDTTKTVTVQRGQFGSTAATHLTGATVFVKPKFSSFDILGAINDDLNDLSSPMNGLYRVRTVDLTFNPAVAGYDMTSVTGVIDILDVRFKQTGSSKYWPRIREYRLERNQAVAEFPSTFALFLYESAQSGQTIHVRYKAAFTALSALTDDVLTIAGLHTEAHDIIETGAAVNLLAGRSVRRSFMDAQGDTRRAEEVSTQDVLISPRGLISQRKDRVQAEAARLHAADPTMIR